MRWGIETPGKTAPPKSEEQGEDEREPRPSRLFVCDMRLSDGRRVKIRVRNISAHGLGGRTDLLIEPWQTVQVMLPQVGAVSGRIAWVRGNQFGVEFLNPIDPAEVTVAAAARPTGHVVPPQFRPSGDHRRPGLRSKS